MPSRGSGAFPETAAVLAAACLAFAALFTTPAACETLLLPERVILGRDLSPPSVPELGEGDLRLPTVGVPTLPAPPGLELERPDRFLGLSAGTGPSYRLEYGLEKDRGYLTLLLASERADPFPGGNYRLVMTTGLVARHPRFEARFFLAPSLRNEQPAARPEAGSFGPAAFPRNQVVSFGASVVFLPDWPFRPQLSVARHISLKREKDGLSLLMPSTTGEAALFYQFRDFAVLRLGLEIEKEHDYGNPAHRRPARFLPGVSLGVRVADGRHLFLEARNIAGRRCELLPGRHAPGVSLLAGWRQSF